jgi:hypothetical protein
MLFTLLNYNENSNLSVKEFSLNIENVDYYTNTISIQKNISISNYLYLKPEIYISKEKLEKINIIL